MSKFPADTSKQKVVKTFQKLGFEIVREKEHVSMTRLSPEGIKTLLTMPNHSIIKSSTSRAVCTRCGISSEEFLKAFEEV